MVHSTSTKGNVNINGFLGELVRLAELVLRDNDRLLVGRSVGRELLLVELLLLGELLLLLVVLLLRKLLLLLRALLLRILLLLIELIRLTKLLLRLHLRIVEALLLRLTELLLRLLLVVLVSGSAEGWNTVHFTVLEI